MAAAVAAVPVLAVLIALAVPYATGWWQATPSPPAAGPVDDEADGPTSRLALEGLRLDDPLARAVDLFGPPDRSEPDINASTAHSWELAGGATLTVGATDGADAVIVALYADVPAHGSVRLRAYGGVVVGETPLVEVVRGWGEGYDEGSPTDDFAVRYIECAGPFPVVVKFDQPKVGADRPDPDQPVTRLLIAHADADPGTAGCPPASA